ncbi:MAG: hypothetical protein HRU15_01570 [Planctomycetes bacterium]|nr:hypothetical protein [Planctomycetota bacterium]
MSGQIYCLEAPNDVIRDIFIDYQAEIDEIIDEARADAQEFKAKLYSALQKEQESNQKRGRLEASVAYGNFVTYFSSVRTGNTSKLDLMGNVLPADKQQLHKKQQFPDANLLPQDGQKRIYKYILLIKELIIDGEKKEHKQKVKSAKKIQAQVKKLTKTSELEQARAVQEFLDVFLLHVAVKDSLTDFLPQPVDASCVLYLSFESYGLLVKKDKIFIQDQSQYQAVIEASSALQVDQGYKGEALRFNEKDSLSIAVPEKLQTAQAMTIAVWIWIENIPDRDQRTIVSNGHQTWEMQIEGKKLFIEGAGSPKSKTVFENEKWYHVAWTSDQTQQCIFVNGVLEGTKSASGLNIQSQPITIGNRSGGNCGPWLGKLDEVMIFSRALNAEDIAKLIK